MRKLLYSLTLVIWMALSNCSRVEGPLVSEGGGSATETVALSGQVKYQDGTAAVGANVILRPASYVKSINPGLAKLSQKDQNAIIRITDSMGNYEMKAIDKGSYVLELNDNNGFGKVIQLEINHLVSTEEFISSNLEQNGVLMGQISVSEPIQTYIQIKGMERIAQVDDRTGLYVFNELPPGDYSLRVVPESNNLVTLDLPSQPVPSKDTALVDHWIISAEGVIKSDSAIKIDSLISLIDSLNNSIIRDTVWIYLNTTSRGANVGSDIQNFPVIVRFGSEFFDTTNCKGQELQFYRNDSIHLPHEVETWDFINKKADIWVLLDTIHGNSEADKFFMTCEEGRFHPNDNHGPSVFRTENNFAAVWHLGQSSLGTGANQLYRNSVEDYNHGDDYVSSTKLDGIAGAGTHLDWDDYILVKNATDRLKPTNELTMAVWIKIDSSDYTGSSSIVNMGDDYGIHHHNTSASVFVYDSPSEDYVARSGSGAIKTGVWHHVVETFHDSLVAIYLDGVLMEEMKHPISEIIYNLSPDFKMGEHGTNKPGFIFSGSIDEVRVSRVARSSNWIRLTYENQSPFGRLIQFLPPTP